MIEMKEQLLEYMQDHPVINTHSHHMPDDFFEGYNLDRLLKQSYVDWCGVTFGESHESRKAYLEKVRYKSYFIWLQKSLLELYLPDVTLAPESWNRLSAAIETANQDASNHIKILKEKCKYKKIILDTYWNPGSDNGHSNYFSPAFRIDPLMYGYSTDAADHDGNSPSKLYGSLPDNLSDYLVWVSEIIAMKKQQGCVTLKCAAAYKRDLRFEYTTKERAERIFLRKNGEESKEEIRDFQNYLFHYLCEAAAEAGLPFQCHTGLGQLSGTRAMEMKTAIERNPETKFVLLHCSYPWTEDVSGLLHRYPNVYPDLAWLPLLSPSATRRTLHELIEVGTADKICWGCDTWTSEESYGALIAFRYAVADVLAEKIMAGYFTLADAKAVADNLLVNNAEALYKL